MSNNSKKFDGILSDPIRYKGAGHYLFNDNSFENDFIAQRLEREKSLYQHYGLPYDPVLKGHVLAMKIAEESIVGFSLKDEKTRAGRPKKWIGKRGLQLYLATQKRLNEKEGRSLREAIKYAALDMGEAVKTEEHLNYFNSRYHDEITKQNQLVKLYKTTQKLTSDEISIQVFEAFFESFCSTNNI